MLRRFLVAALRRFFVAAVLVISVFVIAATGTSTSNAIAIATIIGAFLPLALKHVPAHGKTMIAIVVASAAATAIVAELLSGEIVLDQLSKADPAILIALAASVYGLTQLMYSLLITSTRTATAVTEPAALPVIAAPIVPVPAVSTDSTLPVAAATLLEAVK